MSFKRPINNEVVHGTIEFKMFVNENEIEFKMWPLVDAFSMEGAVRLRDKYNLSAG